MPRSAIRTRFSSGNARADRWDGRTPMRMTAIMMTKKINTLLIEMNISKKELARRLNTSPSNLSGKLKRDNFTEKELRQIAALCSATFEACFVTDTGRRI